MTFYGIFSCLALPGIILLFRDYRLSVSEMLASFRVIFISVALLVVGVALLINVFRSLTSGKPEDVEDDGRAFY
jgi:NADH:ubiquinone oxidoreductase subunit K